MLIDFSGAFDRVNLKGFNYKLQDGVDMSIVCQFLHDRTQCVVFDGVSSRLVDVMSGMPQGRVLGPLLYILYTAELFYLLENILVCYAGDSTPIAIVRSPGDRSRL